MQDYCKKRSFRAHSQRICTCFQTWIIISGSGTAQSPLISTKKSITFWTIWQYSYILTLWGQLEKSFNTWWPQSTRIMWKLNSLKQPLMHPLFSSELSTGQWVKTQITTTCTLINARKLWLSHPRMKRLPTKFSLIKILCQEKSTSSKSLLLSWSKV